jgi:hypothetical protein
MHQPTSWTERTAAELLDLEAELRPLLRRLLLERGAVAPVDPKSRRLATRSATAGSATITLSAREIRTLLRAAMPVPVTLSRAMRTPHARMNAALGVFAARLLALGEAHRMADEAIAAGLALRDELAAWIDAARWVQATRRAKLAGWGRNRAADFPINPIIRLSTGPNPNSQGTDQPAAAAPPQPDLLGLALFHDEADPSFSRKYAQHTRAVEIRMARAALAAEIQSQTASVDTNTQTNTAPVAQPGAARERAPLGRITWRVRQRAAS